VQKKYTQSPYHNSFEKICFDLSVSILGTILFTPLFFLISLLLKIANGGPVFFLQKRVGKDKKTFVLIKFRTMEVGSEKLQRRYGSLNEADGPVFKIFDDPRYTKLGKYLAHTGLDELPQLINVLKGEMSIVGPRPLPIYEADKLIRSHKIRELVKPGITSGWVVSGSHKLTFAQWMKLDKDYVKYANISTDLTILTKTILIMLRQILKQALLLLNF